MLNMSSAPDNIYFKRKPSKICSIHSRKPLVLLIKQHSKKFFGGSKPSSKLTLKTKWYHSCGCCDDSHSCKQLKKHVKDKYFGKKLDFES